MREWYLLLVIMLGCYLGVHGDRKLDRKREEPNTKRHQINFKVARANYNIEQSNPDEEETDQVSSANNEFSIKREDNVYDKPKAKIELIVEAENMEMTNKTSSNESMATKDKPRQQVNLSKGQPSMMKIQITKSTTTARPRNRDTSAKRGDMWYLQPNRQRHRWNYYGSERRYPANHRESGRWWYYRGGMDQGSQFKGRFRYNRL